MISLSQLEITPVRNVYSDNAPNLVTTEEQDLEQGGKRSTSTEVLPLCGDIIGSGRHKGRL